MSNQTTPPDEIPVTPTNAKVTMNVSLDANKDAQLDVDIPGGTPQKVVENTYVTVDCGDGDDAVPIEVQITASSDFRTLTVESGSSSPWHNSGNLEASENLRLEAGSEVEDQVYKVTATDNDGTVHVLDPYIRLRRTNYQVYPGTTNPTKRSTA